METKIFGISLDDVCNFSGGYCKNKNCNYFHPLFVDGYCVFFMKFECKNEARRKDCPLDHISWKKLKKIADYRDRKDYKDKITYAQYKEN
jgi:hypothetical protein